MTTRILQGHVLDVLRGLPAASVHCVVTSPPYYGLRNYRLPPMAWPDGWVGDLGLEPTLALYLDHMVSVCREIRRLLRKDGSFWLNIGDSYANWIGPARKNGHFGANDACVGTKVTRGFKEKDLMLIPARLAIRLQEDGWYVRSDIIWAKRAPMPESCTDRPTSAHEHVFLLTKSAKYFYDAEAVKEEANPDNGRDNSEPYCRPSVKKGGFGGKTAGSNHPAFRAVTASRNLRNVWLLAPSPFPEAHFATFPPEIPRRAILAGTSAKGCCPKCGAGWVRVLSKTRENRSNAAKAGTVIHGKGWATDEVRADHDIRNGPCVDTETLGWRPSCQCTFSVDDKSCLPAPCTVLDPFLGSGTTALVADRLGRDCIGIELSEQYVTMARNRIADDAGMFAEVAECL